MTWIRAGAGWTERRRRIWGLEGATGASEGRWVAEVRDTGVKDGAEVSLEQVVLHSLQWQERGRRLGDLEPHSGYGGSALMPRSRLGPQERYWPQLWIQSFQQTQKPPVTREKSTCFLVTTSPALTLHRANQENEPRASQAAQVPVPPWWGAEPCRFSRSSTSTDGAANTTVCNLLSFRGNVYSVYVLIAYVTVVLKTLKIWSLLMVKSLILLLLFFEC